LAPGETSGSGCGSLVMTGMASADCASAARPTLAANRQTARWRLGRSPVIISIDKLPFVDRRNHFHLQARSDLNLVGCLGQSSRLRWSLYSTRWRKQVACRAIANNRNPTSSTFSPGGGATVSDLNQNPGATLSMLGCQVAPPKPNCFKSDCQWTINPV
jgi:hypothetical protein